MFHKISQLYQKHKEVILYLIFGGLTTVVNWVVFFPLFYYTPLSSYGTVCNAIAWVAAVIFAFLTNKPFVFESHDWSWKVLFPELTGFVGCRIFSFLLESVFILVTIDYLHWNGITMKILISVIVVIVNYIGSKLLFKNSK